MSLAITIGRMTQTNNQIRVLFEVTASGNYTTGGDTLNFLTATYPIGMGPYFTKPPQFVTMQSQPVGAAGSGYVYGFVGGTTPANGKMQVFQSAGSAAPLAEIAGAPTAYPAGVLADVISGEAVFDKEV